MYKKGERAMNRLDKMMKKERKTRYKRLKKMFRARDMARKYTNRRMPISKLDDYFNKYEHERYFTSDLARRIIREENRIMGVRPKLPKTQNVKQKNKEASERREINLTENHMKDQSELGYLHVRERKFYNDFVVLSYSKEGQEPSFFHGRREEAEKILKHWGKTGTLIIEKYDFVRNERTEEIEYPDVVVMLGIEKKYSRKNPHLGSNLR